MDEKQAVEDQTDPDHVSGNTAYALDKQDRIVMINGQWDNFARDNDGNGIFAADIRGQSIWQFISGDPTRMWFDVLLQRVKLKQVSIERPYRCDSPDMKRFMKMRISYEENLLMVENTLIHTEPRIAAVHIHGTHIHETPGVKLRCSVCGNIFQNNRWYEPDELPIDTRANMQVAYVICEACSIQDAKIPDTI